MRAQLSRCCKTAPKRFSWSRFSGRIVPRIAQSSASSKLIHAAWCRFLTPHCAPAVVSYKRTDSASACCNSFRVEGAMVDMEPGTDCCNAPHVNNCMQEHWAQAACVRPDVSLRKICGASLLADRGPAQCRQRTDCLCCARSAACYCRQLGPVQAR